MAVQHASKYYRLPTRLKVQVFWISVVVMSGGYQLTKMITTRVTPKRTESTYEQLKEQYPDGLPEYLMEQSEKIAQFRDGASLTNILKVPQPGETTAAMHYELDPRRLGAHRKQ